MAEITESANTVSQRRALLLQKIIERRRESSEQEQKISPRKTTGDCPLSYAQELMWLLDKLNAEGVTAYNSIWTGRLRGSLNTTALLQSLNTIIERHQVLRTIYVEVDGVPAQRVTEQRLRDLGLIDLSDLPEPLRETEAVRLLEEEVRRPFDLSQDLMMRATLLRMSEQDHFLLLDMHHIAIDGWAKDIIYRELSAFYEAFSTGKPHSLPEPPIQYADFAVWQREWITGQALDDQLVYWVRRLSGAPPLLELPADYPRPAAQMFRGNHERTVFPASLLHGLKALGQQEGATLFMTLMAGFQSVLHRYAGRDDMLVATVVANRPRPELENLIGYFSNSLVLRADFSGDPSFRDLLHQIRDLALDAYDHQDLPFEKLVVKLRPDRDLSYSPLFQVMFNLQNHEREAIKMQGLSITEIKTERGSSKFDLTLNIWEKTDGLRVAFEYNTDLFKPDTIQRLLGHFRTLLEGAVRNPAERISRLPMLTPPERRQILVEWNDTKADFPKDLCTHQLIEEQAQKTPDAIALVWGDLHLTYAELERRANQLAHYLKKHGVGPETRVVICVERSLEMVIGVLGILKAGGAYIPLDAEFAKERLPVILQDAQPTLLLTQQHLRSAKVSYANIKTVLLDSDWPIISQESTATPASRAAPQNLAYVIYTSGSTGKPKGVMITHASLVNAYQAWEAAYQLSTAVKVHLQMANFSFDVFTGDLVRALCSGGKLVLCPLDVLLDPAQLYDQMVQHNIDCAEFVPSVLRNLLRHLQQSGQTLDFLRVVVSGSDTWHVEEHLAIEHICGPETRVINGYGVAEATIDSCRYERKGSAGLPNDGIVPIGRPFHNTRLYILDRNLQPVPVGVPGELFIAGDGLARGYLNNADLTAQRFLPETLSSEAGGRMYKTGDLARYRPDGNIEFLGRTDHQIKIRGFRVELGEIEMVLSQHEDVEQAVVVAQRQPTGENQLIGYAVPKAQRTTDKNNIRQFLKERLPAYMVPPVILILPAFPLSTNGKVDRNALPLPEIGSQEREVTFVAPRDAREQQLAQVWSEVLRVNPISIHDNFFDLGGHSLLIMQVLSRLRERFGMQVTVREVFERPTIAEIAELLNCNGHRSSGNAEDAIIPLSRDTVRATRST
jgi:amino acid adenylation domain-containing protein